MMVMHVVLWHITWGRVMICNMLAIPIAAVALSMRRSSSTAQHLAYLDERTLLGFWVSLPHRRSGWRGALTRGEIGSTALKLRGRATVVASCIEGALRATRWLLLHGALLRLPDGTGLTWEWLLAV